MPGISDSGNPDDISVHLEQILSADGARAEGAPTEGERERLGRESVRLPLTLRARAQAALDALAAAVPGLGNAAANKLLMSRAGRDALTKGKNALARVDNHLHAVTGTRNPQIGRSYGVYGSNPLTFGGVYRALVQSVSENERLSALPEGHADRERLFTPYVALMVNEAHEALKALLGARIASRAELSSRIAIKQELLDEAKAVISHARSHLYANLPLGRRDPDLREYGFRPIRQQSGAPAQAETELDPSEAEADEDDAS